MQRKIWNLKSLKTFVIAGFCISAVCDAQHLCREALSVTPSMSSTNVPESLKGLMEIGYFFPVTESARSVEIDSSWIQESIRQRREFPFLFTDLIFSSRPSVFHKQILTKIKMDKKLYDCWRGYDCSSYGVNVPRKFHLVDLVSRREVKTDSSRGMKVVQNISTIVPGRMMFSRIEVSSLAKLYNDIRKDFSANDLREIASSSATSILEREISLLALKSEREFVEHYTLTSMKSVGYIEGRPDEIVDHISAYYAPVKRIRSL